MHTVSRSGPALDAPRSDPLISVIIPAWNEARELPATLANLRDVLAERSEPAELIVVDNASDDATAAVAAAGGARVVTEPHRQIARARNTGARAARGQLLLFIDADTRPPATLVHTALDLLRSGQCCGGGGHLRFEDGSNALLRIGANAWNRLASGLGLGAGCFLFATRDAFAAIGGFDEHYYAGEEIGFSRRLRRYGKHHAQPLRIIDQPPVLTSPRKADWHGIWQQLGLLLLVLVYPFALRSRRLCWFWYQRPATDSAQRCGNTGP